MPFIVLCPIKSYPALHMSFSKVYEHEHEARDHCNQLRHLANIIAPYKSPWGQKSTLYVVDHALYNNERPPHVEFGPVQDIEVLLKDAYVKEIKA